MAMTFKIIVTDTSSSLYFSTSRRICGSHSGDYQRDGYLGCGIVKFGRKVAPFQRNFAIRRLRRRVVCYKDVCSLYLPHIYTRNIKLRGIMPQRIVISVQFMSEELFTTFLQASSFHSPVGFLVLSDGFKCKWRVSCGLLCYPKVLWNAVDWKKKVIYCANIRNICGN
jgi:hypothetical protein